MKDIRSYAARYLELRTLQYTILISSVQCTEGVAPRMYGA